MASNKEKLTESILRKFEDIERQLGDPAVMENASRLRELSRERAKLSSAVELIREVDALGKQLNDVTGQLEAEKDPEFIEVLKEEKENLAQKFEELSAKLEVELLPKHPDKGKNMYVEVRAGTGGDEAALFARDLYRMYTRFCEKRGLRFEQVSVTETGLNGLKEVIFLVSGDEAFDLFHLEAGTHRVQRIPETESGGRIHTSACTVSVLAEVEENEIDINPNDLRIDVYRSSGPGGQSVNTTDSAVRITHIPTGVVVTCQDEKSQHKNKAKALSVLQARLVQKEQEESREKSAQQKRAQIGSGDRSEKIRTYNYPQSRVTDHRINYTSHNLDKMMDGELYDLVETLLRAEQEKQLAEVQRDS